MLYFLNVLGVPLEAGIDSKTQEPEDFPHGLVSISIKMSASSAIQLLGMHGPNEMESRDMIRSLPTQVQTCIISHSQKVETPECPMMMKR